MRIRSPHFFMMAVLLSVIQASACNSVFAGSFENSSQPDRLRRANSFFGLHFDFHASMADNEIGKTVTREMVEELILRVRPDYIQVDTKGHKGISSYPTDVGTRSGGYVGDQLKIWRDVTAEYGVALYGHHSGVADKAAIQKHPEWARIDDSNKPDTEMTSVFGGYADGLLIPQLKELRTKYGLDGVWIDGECWAVQFDYCDKTIERFRKATGINIIPRNPRDKGYYEFAEVCRAGFREYLRHYVDELHAFDKNYQVTSNWAFTSLMPEPVSADVDFISGDYMPFDSVNAARFEGRCIRSQGKPWDLMAWGFRHFDNASFNYKTAVQLEQEAAAVLSLGGGFQIYFQQRHDGSIPKQPIAILEDVAKFCRARQPYCQGSSPIPQIALLYYGKGMYKAGTNLPRLFGHWGANNALTTPMQGVLLALLDSQYIVDITMEHHLRGQMEKYKAIVIPEWSDLDVQLKNELLDYARVGGSLLIIGSQASRQFADELNITPQGEPRMVDRWIEYTGRVGNLQTSLQDVVVKDPATVRCRLYNSMFCEGNSVPAATVANYGKGKIAAVYLNYGVRYYTARSIVQRDFLASIIREIFVDPVVEVSGSHLVEVVATRKNGSVYINLMNTGGNHSDKTIQVFDEIPAVGPLDIKLRIAEKPKKVILQPQGRVLDFNYKQGLMKCTLPRLGIYDIIEVR
jgi:hypothetical protein